MRPDSVLFRMVMAFFVCTACITLLEGILGMLFFPQVKLGYEAFFSPPLFGLLSVLSGIVNHSGKELSVRQVLARRLLHLFMVEGLVFGFNYAGGAVFEPLYVFSLAVSVALVFLAVYVVLWVNDQRSAVLFNEQLKIYQDRQKESYTN